MLKEENVISNLSHDKFSQQEKKFSTEKNQNGILKEKEIRWNIKPNKEQNVLKKEKHPENTKLVDNVTKFVLGELTSREFFRILRLNDINPDLEINKWIKSINHDTHYNNSMTNIVNSKDK